MKKECSGQKGKIYLIASSSQYDEKVIPEIEEAFSAALHLPVWVLTTCGLGLGSVTLAAQVTTVSSEYVSRRWRRKTPDTEPHRD